MSDPISLTIEGAVATVTLNAPERLNALDHAMWQSLGDTMRTLGDNTDLRAVVITGAGTAFAAGGDISEFDTLRANSAVSARYAETLVSAMDAIWHCPHPTIARIQGPCIGGGLEIALCCDLRIAATDASFGIPINRLGLTMAYGEMQRFVAVLGRAVFMELVLEGTIVSADVALTKGLVGSVVSPEELDACVAKTVKRIASAAPLAQRGHKRMLNRLLDPTPLNDAERASAFDTFDSDDFAEGVRAFREKRKPDFSGR